MDILNKFKSEIEQIEDMELKDIKTIGDLIDVLKRHKEIFMQSPGYHALRRIKE